MEYVNGYSTSAIDQLDNIYKSALLSRSFTALLENFVTKRKKSLLEQVALLYRKRGLLKRGYSALYEYLQIKRLFNIVSHRQLVGTFLLRWRSISLKRHSVRNFAEDVKNNILRKCFNVLYNPVKLRTRWQQMISKFEKILFNFNSRFFISEINYFKEKSDSSAIAEFYYNFKIYKKVIKAINSHFKFIAVINSFEFVLNRHALKYFLIRLQKINETLEREKKEVECFRKKLIFNAWRDVTLSDIADRCHDIFLIHKYLFHWRVTAAKLNELNLRYNQFVKKIDRNILANAFNKIIKLINYKRYLVIYMNSLENLFKNILLHSVFEKFKFNSALMERFKMMMKQAEVAYSSSLKRKSVNSFIKFVLLMKTKSKLNELASVWSLNNIKSKYFYGWQKQLAISQTNFYIKLEAFSQNYMNDFKRKYLCHWFRYTNKMATLRHVSVHFSAKNEVNTTRYYWNILLKLYIHSKHKSIEIFIDHDTSYQFNRTAALYPLQILSLFSSPCSEHIKNINFNKSLFSLIELLNSNLPRFYSKIATVTCRYHDKSKYSCLIASPKWKTSYISYQIRCLKRIYDFWRTYAREKTERKMKLQVLVEQFEKSRSERLVSLVFYAWIELMAEFYSKQREKFLSILTKCCSVIQNLIDSRFVWFFDEFKEIKYHIHYCNSVKRLALTSFRKQLCVKRSFEIGTERHDYYLVKKCFFEWGNYVFDKQANVLKGSELIEVLLRQKYFKCVKLLFISLKFDKTIENNLKNLARNILYIWLDRANLMKKVNEFALSRKERREDSVLIAVLRHLATLPKLRRLRKNVNRNDLRIYFDGWKSALSLSAKLNFIQSLLYNNLKDMFQCFINNLAKYQEWCAKLERVNAFSRINTHLESLCNLSTWRMNLGLKTLLLNLKLNQIKINVKNKILSECFMLIKTYANNEKMRGKSLILLENKLNNKILSKCLQRAIVMKIEDEYRSYEFALLTNSFYSWKSYTFDAEAKKKLENVILWSQRRRAAEGLRRLRQFTMVKKWQALCNHQASIFRAIKDVSITKIAFAGWKAAVNKEK